MMQILQVPVFLSNCLTSDSRDDNITTLYNAVIKLEGISLSEAERTTLEKILTVAKLEFLQKGFQGASLRNIVKKAGVTTGAFYGYFKSKDELFEALVKDQYAGLLEMYREILTDFEQMPPENQRTEMVDYTLEGIFCMTDYVYSHLDAFKLILCCSEGTPYENLIRDLTQLDYEATHNFSQAMNENGVPMNAVHPQLGQILTSGMFYAYFELVVRDIPKECATEYIKQLVSFYEAGWKRIMGY